MSTGLPVADSANLQSGFVLSVMLLQGLLLLREGASTKMLEYLAVLQVRRDGALRLRVCLMLSLGLLQWPVLACFVLNVSLQGLLRELLWASYLCCGAQWLALLILPVVVVLQEVLPVVAPQICCWALLLLLFALLMLHIGPL
jgi:hypothetical protein